MPGYSSNPLERAQGGFFVYHFVLESGRPSRLGKAAELWVNMRSQTVFFILAFLTSWGCSSKSNPVSPPPPVAIEDLVQEFKANRDDAIDKYVGPNITVTGMVLDSKGLDLKNADVVIGDSKGGSDSSARLYLNADRDDPESFATLRMLAKGKVVEVRGLLHQAGRENEPFHLANATVVKIDGKAPGAGQTSLEKK